MNSNILQKN